MKNIAIIALASLVLITACKKKDTNKTLVVPIPNISMEILGPSIVSLAIGGTFVDTYGANYHNEYGDIEYISSPTKTDLNLSSAGFYSLTYSAKSKYGYIAKANRLVLVSSAPAAEDFSGIYTRTTGQTVTVTKEGPGLYKIDNVGGNANLPSYIFDVYFGKVDNTSKIVVPTQVCPIDGSDLTCKNAKITISGQDTILEWNVDNSNNYGSQLRTFIK